SGTAEYLLDVARPDTGEPPGAGCRHSVPDGHFLSQPRTGAGGSRVESRNGGFGQIPAADCDRDCSRAGVLARGRVPPAIPSETRAEPLPYLTDRRFGAQSLRFSSMRVPRLT